MPQCMPMTHHVLPPQHQRHLQDTEASGILASSKRKDCPSQPRTTFAEIFPPFLFFSLPFTFTRMLLCLQPTRGQPQSDISPGPALSIVLREPPGLLFCRTRTQKVSGPPDPRNAYRTHYPGVTTQYSWVGADGQRMPSHTLRPRSNTCSTNLRK